MRVITGTARGMRLSAPKGIQTRPTSDRVKEALFSILESRIKILNSCVLDICAGTGAIGIEAMSRGAKSCYFIEHSRDAMSIIKKNISSTKLLAKTEFWETDVVQGLNILAAKRAEFDIIFFDPPYSAGLYDSVIKSIEKSDMLSNKGIFVVECSQRQTIEIPLCKIIQVDSRVYGDTVLKFYTRNNI